VTERPERAGRVAVRGLAKAYAGRTAVADVSFDIGAGEVLGLLGPNGAGKSTTVEASCGLTSPDAGSIAICGIDVRRHARAARQVLGVALQTTGLQGDITCAEALQSFAAFYRAPVPAADLLERFGLAAVAHRRFGSLSGGERQRLALALALVNDPAVLFLDEPTAQLDPQMRREVHDQIRRMKREGRALLLATHDMDEAAELCDRLLVLHEGRVVAAGTPGELAARSTVAQRVRLRTDAPVAPQWLADCPAIAEPVFAAEQLQFASRDLNAALAQLARILSLHGVQIVELVASRGRLDDFIVDLIQAQSGAGHK
jgi:ABC-2 type transport system ATP-binding protein